MEKINFRLLVSCFLAVFAVAFLGNIFTTGGVKSDWYLSVKPSITPPDLVFPVVWGILFFLIALSLYFAWTNCSQAQRPEVTLVFGANFALNVLWSFLFFKLRNPLLAFAEIILLLLSILAMILFTHKIDKKASYLLVPYFAWGAFASVLNYFAIH